MVKAVLTIKLCYFAFVFTHKKTSSSDKLVLDFTQGVRVSTPQGKGKMMKSNSRWGKHREFQNFWKTQGKHRESENLIRSQDQDNNSKQNYYLMSMVLFLKLNLLSLYYGNTPGKLKLHREKTGKIQGILLSKMRGNRACLKANLRTTPIT